MDRKLQASICIENLTYFLNSCNSGIEAIVAFIWLIDTSFDGSLVVSLENPAAEFEATNDSEYFRSVDTQSARWTSRSRDQNPNCSSLRFVLSSKCSSFLISLQYSESQEDSISRNIAS